MRLGYASLLITALIPPAFAQGVITTVAGGTYLDNVPAKQVRLELPFGMVADSQGNIYFTDVSRIRKFNRATGIVSTVAGGPPLPTGLDGDGPAMQVAIKPSHLALLPDGRILFLNGQCLRQLDLTASTVTTLPGLCSASIGTLGLPNSIATDSSGNVYMTTSKNGVEQILRMDAQTRQVTVFAGSDQRGNNSDGLSRTVFSFVSLGGIQLDASRNVFVLDRGRGRVYRIDSKSGSVTTVPGNQSRVFQNTFALALAPNGDIFVGETGRIFRIDVTTGNITIAVGAGHLEVDQNGIPASLANIDSVSNMMFDQAGNLWLSEAGRIHLLNFFTGQIMTVIGTAPNGDGGPAIGALVFPVALAVGPEGDLFIAEETAIRRVDRKTGLISKFAGGGQDTGDNAPLLEAAVRPRRLLFNTAGDLFFAEPTRVRKIIAGSGTVSDFAGSVVPGFSGDGGPAKAARLNNPSSLAIDRAGNVFISDAANGRIRKVDSSGIITTLSEVLLTAGALAIDTQDRLLVATMDNLLRVEPDGKLSRLAKTGDCSNLGDGGPAQLSSLCGGYLAVDDQGNIFLGLRRIDASTGIVQTVAGGGTSEEEGIPATSASLVGPGMALHKGDLYVGDIKRVRKVSPAVPPPLPASPGDFQIVDAATFLPAAIAPGQIVTLKGHYLGPPEVYSLTLGPEGKVATELGGVQVLFNEIPAPLLYVSAGQINAVVPYGLNPPSQVRVRVRTAGGSNTRSNYFASAGKPSLFPGAILNQDGTLNSKANPAPKESVLTVFGHGMGRLTPPVEDGTVVQGPVLPKTSLTIFPSVANESVGSALSDSRNYPATALYLGPAPGFVAGVLQANIQLPPGLAGGPARLALLTDGQNSWTPIFIAQGTGTPVIESVLPANPGLILGETLTIKGTNFDMELSVDLYFQGLPAPTFRKPFVRRVSGTSIEVQIDIWERGEYALEVVNPGGLRSSRYAFTVR